MSPENAPCIIIIVHPPHVCMSYRTHLVTLQNLDRLPRLLLGGVLADGKAEGFVLGLVDGQIDAGEVVAGGQRADAADELGHDLGQLLDLGGPDLGEVGDDDGRIERLVEGRVLRLGRQGGVGEVPVEAGGLGGQGVGVRGHGCACVWFKWLEQAIDS